ncbi:Uncharacterised protein [Mycobacteroides abscessus subsp. abscessus]|nr:Uncharacterised protein [Mycobacteroides abscessus subsp. abscessus]
MMTASGTRAAILSLNWVKRWPLMMTCGLAATIRSRFGSRWLPMSWMDSSAFHGLVAGINARAAAAGLRFQAFNVSKVRLSRAT